MPGKSIISDCAAFGQNPGSLNDRVFVDTPVAIPTLLMPSCTAAYANSRVNVYICARLATFPLFSLLPAPFGDAFTKVRNFESFPTRRQQMPVTARLSFLFCLENILHLEAGRFF